jgi:hypothetical protein
MTVKITAEEPNVFPTVEDVDARDDGSAAVIFLGDKDRTPVRHRDYQFDLRTGRRPCDFAKSVREHE